MRWLPLAAFAIFFAAGAALLSRDPALRRRAWAYAPGSSLNEGPYGTSLARAYLERTGASPRTLTTPLAQADVPAGAVLLRLDVKATRDRRPMAFPEGPAPDGGARASTPPKSGLTPEEDAFARSGGRLVLSVEGEATTGESKKVSFLLPGVSALSSSLPRALPSPALIDAQPIFEHGETPSIVRAQVGAGEVYWLSEPELLSNARLGSAEHLALLLALCQGRTPVFDEAVHGIVADVGMLELLRRWGFGPALLLGCFLTLLLFWRRAAIAGPPADPFRDTRSESVELLDSMAALYQKALSPEEALRLYRTRVVHEIALTLALPERRASELLAAQVPAIESGSSFRERLSLLASACERFRHEHRRSR
jgi:hypothetical protein